MKYHYIYIVLEKSKLFYPENVFDFHIKSRKRIVDVGHSIVTIRGGSSMDTWYKSSDPYMFDKRQREEIYEWYKQANAEIGTFLVFLFYPFHMFVLKDNDMVHEHDKEQIMIPYSSKKIRYPIAFGITSEYLEKNGGNQFLKADNDIKTSAEWGVLFNNVEQDSEWTVQDGEEILYMPKKSHPVYVFHSGNIENDMFGYSKERESHYEIKKFKEEMFPLIYFISLPKRVSWVRRCIETWGFDHAKVFSAVTDVKMSNTQKCFLSHILVLREAMKKGQNVLIFEDDVYISLSKWVKNHGDKSVITVMNECFRQLPDRWDIVYFGKCVDLCSTSKRVSEYLHHIYYPLCSHSYYVHRDTIPLILRIYETQPFLANNAYDHFLKKMIRQQNLQVYGSSIFDQDLYQTSTIQTSMVYKEACIETYTTPHLFIILTVLLIIIWILMVIKMMIAMI